MSATAHETSGNAVPATMSIIDEQVALVTLNRPAARNAVNAEMATRLEAILQRVELDEKIRVAIITGAGDRAFCAGADLKQVAVGGLSSTFTDEGGFAAFVTATKSKPWIAAVNGTALAGGFEIVLACDMAIASVEAHFGLPEVKRGLIASGGGLYRLPRALPKAIALELVTTGKSITADRAYQLGLVNRVVDAEQVLPAAMTLAQEICANAPLAVRDSVVIARLAARFDDRELREICDLAQARLSSTFDFKEGSRAFVEKRLPNWLGR